MSGKQKEDVIKSLNMSGRKTSGVIYMLSGRDIINSLTMSDGMRYWITGRYIIKSITMPGSRVKYRLSGRDIIKSFTKPGKQVEQVEHVEQVKQVEDIIKSLEWIALIISPCQDIIKSLNISGGVGGYIFVYFSDMLHPNSLTMSGEASGAVYILFTFRICYIIMLLENHKFQYNSASALWCVRLVPQGALKKTYKYYQISCKGIFLAENTGYRVQCRFLAQHDGAVISGKLLEKNDEQKPKSGFPFNNYPPNLEMGSIVDVLLDFVLVKEILGVFRAFFGGKSSYLKSGGLGRPVGLKPFKRVRYTAIQMNHTLLLGIWSVNIEAAVSSLSFNGTSVIVGTEESEIYELYLADNETQIKTRLRERTDRKKRKVFGESKKTHIRDRWRSVKLRSSMKKSPGDAQGLLVDGRVIRLPKSPPTPMLLSSCHSQHIYDVTFPRGVNDLVVTSGVDGLRVWNVRSLEEVLRVTLTGLVCTAASVNNPPSTIVTGWSDGRLRWIGAESGRVMLTVNEAHCGGVTCVLTTTSGHVYTAGRDGRVRMWEVKGNSAELKSSQKEHRGEVTHLSLHQSETLMLSSAADGSCILWDIPSLVRKYRLSAHTVFLGGAILNNRELLTVGTDGSVLVWEREDGSLLADLPAADQAVTTITASQDDSIIVTAGEDSIIKVWDWRRGRVVAEGRGHSGAITRVALSPDGKICASVGKDGALLIWKHM
ncbi:unnamed protein product, partial [Meganyctiphanes norvegica]